MALRRRSEDDKPLDAKRVRELYEKGRDDVREEVGQAGLNRAFVGGRQWVYMDPTSRRVLDAPRKMPSRIRATINKVGPDSERVKAKLLRRAQAFEVMPKSADDAAMEGSKVAEAALYDVVDRHKWESLRVDFVSKAWETGTALLCSEWDPTAGRPLPGTEMHEGDERTSVLDVTQAVTGCGVKDIETARWWIKAEAMPPDDVKAWYPKFPGEPDGDASTTETSIARRFGDAEQASKMVLVLTYFERPNPARKKGVVLTVVNDHVVDGPHDWPFPYSDRLNVTAASPISVDARWAGATPLSEACKVQVLFNQAHSSILEHARNCGNARGLSPSGVIDDLSTLTDTPGEWIEYRPLGDGLKPEYMSPPNVPQYLLDLPDRLGERIDDILGVHDVSRGIAPTNIESGIGVSVLSENDDTPTGALAKVLGEAWGRHATNTLELMGQNVVETREAIGVDAGIAETVRYTGVDFAGQTRVKVPLDSVIPRSRAAQQAFAMQMHDRFGDQPGFGFAKFARIADLPDQDSMIDAVDSDTALARRENRLMAAGRPRMVNKWDVDDNHIMVHVDFMRTARFEQLSPEAQADFEAHYKAHEVQKAEKAGAAVAMQIGGMAPTQVGGTVQPALLPPGAEQTPSTPDLPDPAGTSQNPEASASEPTTDDALMGAEELPA